MREELGLNQGPISKERKDPHIGKAITDRRWEGPTGEMHIAEMVNHTIGPMTITRMILEGQDITPTKAKITGGKMDTPTEEVLEDL